MSEPDSSFEHLSVAAILARRSHEDQSELLEDLVAMLCDVVPGVQVERSLLRRRVQSIRLPLGGFIYRLTRSSDQSYEAARQQEVRGVVIRTDPLEIGAFLAELGPAIDAELQRTERGRDALRAWLNSVNS